MLCPIPLDIIHYNYYPRIIVNVEPRNNYEEYLKRFVVILKFICKYNISFVCAIGVIQLKISKHIQIEKKTEMTRYKYIYFENISKNH